MARETDYVLGTHEDELRRLGIQHEVWGPMVLDCWRRSGVGPGQTVLDVGAGPGYAAVDLAELVGPTGKVIAMERSARYAEAGRQTCQRRGLRQVEYHQLDLMTDAWPAAGVDAAWCRWVTAFVASPRLLVEKLATAVRPGGVVMFHEYGNYASWRLAPRRVWMEEFVGHVMSNWRESGGEPDIGLELPTLLAGAGFRLRETRPLLYCLRPGEAMWAWPASFVHTHPDRLVELGRVSAAWAAGVKEQFRAVEREETTRMLTPVVLEIVAERLR